MTEERRLAAIMFSDICGFSSTMGADEARALAIVDMHKQCVADGAALHGGRIAKEMGDGLLVEFSSAVNAVRCAVAVQRAVSDFNKSAEPEETFLLRIGIHVGDVVVAGDDILGDGVNVASRIEPLAEPGGICISRDIFDLVRNKISIETVHLGAHDLKNISRQVSIYKVLLDAVAPGNLSTPTIKTKKPWLHYGLFAGTALLLLAVGVVIYQRQPKPLAPTPPQSAPAKTPTAPPVKDNGSTTVSPTPNAPEPSSDQSIIKQRHIAFVKAVIDEDRTKALSFLSPAIVKKAHTDLIWRRLQRLSNVISIQSGSRDDLRIKVVKMMPDEQTAKVIMQYRRPQRNGHTEPWNDTKPVTWKRIENSWYLVLDGKRNVNQPTDNRLPNRPRAGSIKDSENTRPLRLPRKNTPLPRHF